MTLSSLNRHATAVLRDVGTPKVGCIERTLKQISAWVEVDSRVEIWRKEDGGRLLEGADWVVGTSNAPLDLVHPPFNFAYTDAIDNITTKVDLLKYCHEHNIKVRTQMNYLLVSNLHSCRFSRLWVLVPRQILHEFRSVTSRTPCTILSRALFVVGYGCRAYPQGFPWCTLQKSPEM